MDLALRVAAYEALANTAGVGRDVLEARLRLLAAKAVELETEVEALRAQASLRSSDELLPNGPIGPTWGAAAMTIGEGVTTIGETRPSLDVLAAALQPPEPRDG